MALDRLPLLWRSISLSRVLIETLRSLEIRRRPCQNASSSVTLVACPPMTTERLRRPLGFVSMVQLGPIIFSGRTHLANCSSLAKPSFFAARISVLPSLWAVFAILAALS